MISTRPGSSPGTFHPLTGDMEKTRSLQGDVQSGLQVGSICSNGLFREAQCVVQKCPEHRIAAPLKDPPLPATRAPRGRWGRGGGWPDSSWRPWIQAFGSRCLGRFRPESVAFSSLACWCRRPVGFLPGPSQPPGPRGTPSSLSLMLPPLQTDCHFPGDPVPGACFTALAPGGLTAAVGPRPRPVPKSDP